MRTLRMAAVVSMALIASCDGNGIAFGRDGGATNAANDAGSDAGNDGGSDAGRTAPDGGCGQGAGCRKQSDCCGGGLLCIAPLEPGEQQCGGPANRSDCDGGVSSCSGAGMVCGGPFCGAYNCIESCATASCPAGSTCQGDGLCVLQACPSAYQCPANESCIPDAGEAHGCTVNPCTVDSDCGSGQFCVEGGCELSLGTCGYPLI